MDDEEKSVRRMLAAVRKVSDELKEESDEKEERNNISSHYGVADKVFKRWVADMVADIFYHPTKNEVLDKYFPKLSAEDRLRVEAYAGAHLLWSERTHSHGKW